MKLVVLMRSTMWGLWWSRVQRLEGRGTRDYICTRQSNHCRSLLLQPINRTVLCLATFALYKLSNTCYFLIHNWMRTNGKQIKDLRFHDGNVYRLCTALTPLFWHSSEDLHVNDIFLHQEQHRPHHIPAPNSLYSLKYISKFRNNFLECKLFQSK